jgi:hypothetical protein
VKRALLAFALAAGVLLASAHAALALTTPFVNTSFGSAAAGGSGFYTLDFILGHSLAPGDTITIDGSSTAPGTQFGSSSAELVVGTTGYAVSQSVTNGGATLTITVPAIAGTIASGTQVEVEDSVTNPTVAGTYHLRVHTSQEASDVTSSSYTISAAAPASIALKSGTPQHATVDTAFAHPLSVHVADQYGNSVSNKSVIFTAPATGPSATFSASSTVTTNGSGNATSPTLTAGAVAGSYLVSASVSGVGTSATFVLKNDPGAPAQVDVLSTSPDEVLADGRSTFSVTASVSDADGNPISGETLEFITSDGQGAGATDNGDGTYTSDSLVAGNAPGSVTVTADDFVRSLTGDAQLVELAAAPAATTGSASAVTETAATLAGSLNPHGSDTSYRFAYGISDHYGQSVPASPSGPITGTTSRTVSAPVTGLQAGTTYHYRLVATNAGGTTSGDDHTFTTSGPLPPAQPTPAGGSGGAGTGTGTTVRHAVLALSGPPKAGRHGVTFRLVCPAAGKCAGTAALSASVRSGKARARRVRLGAASFSLSPGQARTLTVRLSRAGRKLLARRHHLRVTLTVTVRGAKQPSIRRTLTLASAR